MRPVCILLITLMTGALVAASPFPPPKHIVVFDGGSGGTRVFVYNINNLTTQWADLKLNDTSAVKPGISTFKTNLPGIGTYLEPLIAFAKSKVPSDLVSSTPIIFNATAGLRILSKDEQLALIDQIQQSLQTTGFKISQVKIIEGKDEGIYAWLAVNYLNGVFREKAKHSTTTGIVELGGASLQIAFAQASSAGEDVYPVTIFGHHYSIYSHSYDGLGGMEAARLYRDPKVCGSEGAGDYQSCKKLIWPAIQKDADCSECGLKNVYQPKIQSNMPFVGLSFFAELSHRYSVSLKKLHLDQTGNLICEKPAPALNALYPKAPKDRLPFACFEIAYSSAVLKELGFTNLNAVTPVLKINDSEVSWTLGAALLAISQ